MVWKSLLNLISSKREIIAHSIWPQIIYILRKYSPLSDCARDTSHFMSMPSCVSVNVQLKWWTERRRESGESGISFTVFGCLLTFKMEIVLELVVSVSVVVVVCGVCEMFLVSESNYLPYSYACRHYHHRPMLRDIRRCKRLWLTAQPTTESNVRGFRNNDFNAVLQMLCTKFRLRLVHMNVPSSAWATFILM